MNLRVLIVLLAVLLVSCGTPDADVITEPLQPPSEPEPVETPPVTEPSAPEPPAAEPSPEPAQSEPEQPETEPVQPTTPSREGLNAEGLPITEARAKAAEYQKSPPTGFGYLAVTSIPVGAYVYLDGERIGVAPIAKWRGKVKQYVFRVDLSGYDTYVETIYIKDNQTLNKTVDLSNLARDIGGGTSFMREGSLQVTTIPDGVTIFIDNKFSEVTPRTIGGLSPNAHELKLRKTGYKEVVKTFTITSGRTTKIHVDMNVT